MPQPRFDTWRGKTKTAAKQKLRKIIRAYEDGLTVSGKGFTVADAVLDWLKYGSPFLEVWRSVRGQR
jgi:hypothetical protein